MRGTGIPIIGDVPWGTHFCQFYRDEQDLIDRARRNVVDRLLERARGVVCRHDGNHPSWWTVAACLLNGFDRSLAHDAGEVN